MNGTIAQLTAVSLLRKWRGVLLALLPAGMLLLALAMRWLGGGDEGVARDTLNAVGLSMVIPLVALIVGTGAISTEVDDGSLVYLLTKPIPRWKITATKMAVAAAAALAFTVIPTLLTGFILTGELGALTGGYVAAAATACIVYCALAVMLGAFVRQAVLVGLIYILMWEGLIAGLVDGARTLSVQHWAAAVGSEVSGGAVEGEMHIAVALVLVVTTTVAALWYAGHRLRSLTLAAES